MGRTLRDIVREREEAQHAVRRDYFSWLWSWPMRYLVLAIGYPAIVWKLQSIHTRGDGPIWFAVAVLPIAQIVLGTIWVAHGRARDGWGKVPWITWFAVPLTLVGIDLVTLVTGALFVGR